MANRNSWSNTCTATDFEPSYYGTHTVAATSKTYKSHRIYRTAKENQVVDETYRNLDNDGCDEDGNTLWSIECDSVELASTLCICLNAGDIPFDGME